MNNRVSRIRIRRKIHVNRIPTINTERIMHVRRPNTTPLSYRNGWKNILESSTITLRYTQLESIIERGLAEAERIGGK
jgi:hypothetical protein